MAMQQERVAAVDTYQNPGGGSVPPFSVDPRVQTEPPLRTKQPCVHADTPENRETNNRVTKNESEKERETMRVAGERVTPPSVLQSQHFYKCCGYPSSGTAGKPSPYESV